ncbi:DUF5979 domain-containing protein [Buchananella felis]|uniref:DUF5979 domain-containing protein n=1 Tax=Buchananella felis TaxID=3231492 RepID=UPI0035298E3D
MPGGGEELNEQNAGRFSIQINFVDPPDGLSPIAFGYTCYVPERDQIQGTISIERFNETFPSPLIPAESTCYVRSQSADEIRLEETYWDFGVQVGGLHQIQVSARLRPTEGALFISSEVNEIEGLDLSQVAYNYECAKEGVNPYIKRGVAIVPTNGRPISVENAIPFGANCKVTEVAASTEVEGFSRTVGDASVTVHIGEWADSTARFDYRYIPTGKGELIILYRESGRKDEASSDDILIDISCGSEYRKVKVDRQTHEAQSVGWFEAGQTCIVAIDTNSLAVPNHSFDAPVQKQVEIVDGQAAEIEIETTYIPDPVPVRIGIEIEGLPAGQENRQFRVNYSCGDVSGSVEVRPGQAPVELEELFHVGGNCRAQFAPESIRIPGYYFHGSEHEFYVTYGRDQVLTLRGLYKKGEGAIRVQYSQNPDVYSGYLDYRVRCDKSLGDGSAPYDVVHGGMAYRNGESDTIDGLAAGAVCTIELQRLHDSKYLMLMPSPVIVTVPNGEVVEVNLHAEWILKTWEERYLKVVPESIGYDSDWLGGYFRYSCRFEGEMPVEGEFQRVEGGFESDHYYQSKSGIRVGSVCQISPSRDLYVPRGYELVRAEPYTLTVEEGSEIAIARPKVEYRQRVSTVNILWRERNHNWALVDHLEPVLSYRCGDDEGRVRVNYGGFELPREYPVGTTCSVSADFSTAQLEGYRVVGPEPKTVTVTEFGQILDVTLEVEYVSEPVLDPARVGTLSVSFALTDYSYSPNGLRRGRFNINWSCGSYSGVSFVEGIEKVVEVDREFPIGTTCRVEIDPESPAFKGYSVKDVRDGTVRIGAGRNYYAAELFLSPKFGRFSVVSSVRGAGVDFLRGMPLTFDYACLSFGGVKEEGRVHANVGQATDPFPVREGICSIKPQGFPNSSSLSWGVKYNGQDLAAPGKMFEVSGAEVNRVEVIFESVGEFPSMSIAAVGDATSPTTYKWSCGHQRGTMDVLGSGIPVTVAERILHGSTCVVWVVPESVPDGWRLVGAPFQIKRVGLSETETSFSFEYEQLLGELEFWADWAGGWRPVDEPGVVVSYSCLSSSGEETQGAVNIGESNPAASVLVAGGSCDLTLSRKPFPGQTFEGMFDSSSTLSKRVVVRPGERTYVHVVYSYRVELGALAVTVNGNGADVASNLFRYKYECSDTYGSGSVVGDGTMGALHEVPIGARCRVWIGDDSAYVPFYDVSLPEPKTVSIESTEPVVVPFEVVYKPRPTSFSVKKTVENGPWGADRAYHDFHYICSNEGGVIAEADLSVEANGQAVTAPESMPAGTSCVINEILPVEPPNGYTLTSTPPQTIQIVAGRNTEVSFVDRYTRTGGSLLVTKAVQGDAAYKAYNQEFEFSYACNVGQDNAENGTFTVRHATPKEISGLPEGS